MRMLNHLFRVPVFVLLTSFIFSSSAKAQVKVVPDGSVGIGTSTPHETAKVHIYIADGQDPQGFIMPVMTYDEMATGIGNGSNDIADGLMVYVSNPSDHSLDGPYYRDANLNIWRRFGDNANIVVTWGDVLEIPDGFEDGIDNVDDADSDPTNELQSWLNLPDIPTDFQDGIDNVNDADSDPTNELQTWDEITGTPNAWMLDGNVASDASVLGTTNEQPLTIITAGEARMTVTEAGDVGIGTEAPSVLLDVNGAVKTGTLSRPGYKDGIVTGYNVPPTANGWVKLRTGIPFTHGRMMAIVQIDAWNYWDSYSLRFGTYLWLNTFYAPSYDFHGTGSPPEAVLVEEDGFVSIAFKQNGITASFTNMTAKLIIEPLNFEQSWLDNWEFVSEDPDENTVDSHTFQHPTNKFAKTFITERAGTPTKAAAFTSAGQLVETPLITEDDVANDIQNNAWSLTGNEATFSSQLGTTTDQPLRIITNGSEKVRISPDGNVGFGVTNPNSRLNIRNTSSSSDNTIRFNGPTNLEFSGGLELLEGVGRFEDAATFGSRLFYNGATNKFSIQMTTAAVTRDVLSINRDNGFTGIGTTEPATRLTVQGRLTSEFPVGSFTNFVVGQESGNNLMTGSHNTFIGNLAGSSNETGHHNTFLSDRAGANNTTGNFNFFVGQQAGFSNTSGNYNTILGFYAGHKNTTGGANTFIGYRAGLGNTTGANNTFIGGEAGYSNAAGTSNHYFGLHAGRNQTGSHNNLFGYYAGKGVVGESTGGHNNFFGYYSGHKTTTGAENNFLGYWAGFDNTHGFRNNYFGSFAGFNISTGAYNNFFGFRAGNGDEQTGLVENNNMFGREAGGLIKSGMYNNFLGYRAGYGNEGDYNNFIGSQAGYSNTTGSHNTFLGSTAGFSNTTGAYNIGIGIASLSKQISGNHNIGIGAYALHENNPGDSGFNIAIGGSALQTGTTASYNVALGWKSLQQSNGNNNVSLGQFSGQYAQNDNSVMIGANAGRNSTGDGIYLGNKAGMNETGASRLYIDNTSTAEPIVYGELDNDRLRLNATVEVRDRIGSATIGTGFTTNGQLVETPLITNNNQLLNGAGYITAGEDNQGTDDQNLGSATLSGNELTIEIENGNSTSVDLSAIIDDEDAGEGVNIFEYDVPGTGITNYSFLDDYGNVMSTFRAGEGIQLSVDENTFLKIASDDNDSDPNNEVNTNMTLSGTTLTIQDGGGSVSEDLSSLKTDDNAWHMGGDNVSSTENRIGTLNNQSLRLITAGEDRLTIDLKGRLIPEFEEKANIAIGPNSGLIGIQTDRNIFIQPNIAVGSAPSGDNIMIGRNTGNALTLQHFSNIFIGEDAGKDATGTTSTSTGKSDNIFLGRQSGMSSTGGSNLFLGKSAGKNSDGQENIFLGSEAGLNNNSSNNIFIGSSAGKTNTNGSSNTFIGNLSGHVNSTGTQNTFLGAFTAEANTSGEKNTFIGFGAGALNTEGQKIVLLGANADCTTDPDDPASSPTAFSNCVAIGADAAVNQSNKVYLHSNGGTITGDVDFSNPSDSRFKSFVTETVPGLEMILGLRPVNYKFDYRTYMQHLVQLMPDSIQAERLQSLSDATSQSRSSVGFIAQEVDQLCQNLSYDFGGLQKPEDGNVTSHYTISYSKFVVPLVKAVQEQQTIIEEKDAEIQALEAAMLQMGSAFEALEQRVRTLENE